MIQANTIEVPEHNQRLRNAAIRAAEANDHLGTLSNNIRLMMQRKTQVSDPVVIKRINNTIANLRAQTQFLSASDYQRGLTESIIYNTIVDMGGKATVEQLNTVFVSYSTQSIRHKLRKLVGSGRLNQRKHQGRQELGQSRYIFLIVERVGQAA